MVRINKFLAECNLGSRRKVEEFILNGDIKVNGEICTDLGRQIDVDNDIVQYKNKRIKPDQEKIFILLNKPQNYVVTKKDEFDRKTIYDLLPEFAKKLNPVGRLDYASEGLLLLTDDGDLSYKIAHPSYQISKTYNVQIDALLSHEEIKKLREGIVIDNKITLPAQVFMKKIADKYCEIKITITEGRNRQIRRMIESLGHHVLKLKRIQVGDISLDNTPTGMWGFLTAAEVLFLVKKTARKPANKRIRNKNENRN
jgi:23S rRNA pseudouridine2605 synthase